MFYILSSGNKNDMQNNDQIFKFRKRNIFAEKIFIYKKNKIYIYLLNFIMFRN